MMDSVLETKGVRFPERCSFHNNSELSSTRSNVKRVNISFAVGKMMDRTKRSDEVFEDFEWMEKMDEFDKQIEQELYEEELIRSCIEQLLEEEEERETMTAVEILQQRENEKLEGRKTQAIAFSSSYRNGLSQSLTTTAQSKLNPNAAVFVPRHMQTSS